MKTLQLISLIAMTSALMACQVEITTQDAILTADADVTADTTNSADQTDSTGDQATDTASNDSGNNTGDQTTGTGSNNDGVTLYWASPLMRVNGNAFALSELGGYEIRYKLNAASEYTHIVIADTSIDQHNFADINNPADYTFEIAAFDVDGVYSDFAIATAN